MFRIYLEVQGEKPVEVCTQADAQIANLDAGAVLDAASRMGLVGRVLIAGDSGEPLAWYEVKGKKVGP